jgi:hypothetical protein
MSRVSTSSQRDRSRNLSSRRRRGGPRTRRLRLEPLEDRRLLTLVSHWEFNEGTGITAY